MEFGATVEEIWVGWSCPGLGLLAPDLGVLQMKGTPGQMCIRGTVSLQRTFTQKAPLELDLPDWDAGPLQRLGLEGSG